jgi:ATP-dependent DNA helicase DinG
MPRQLLTLGAAYGADPREAGYEAFLAETIGRLVTAVACKTLVLFTSYNTLQAVYERLAQNGALREIELLAQRPGTPRARLIETFREAQRAVLLGTASFWHGVDFPGRELEMLIVTRLPFPVPTDPRAEAIAEALEIDGRSSFNEYTLPEAVLRLRQGIGRLIRRSSDRGICVILDPRLLRARYGKTFCAALPAAPRAVRSQAELLELVGDWL